MESNSLVPTNPAQPKSQPLDHSAPVIFWHSDPVGPNETVVLAGGNFSSDALGADPTGMKDCTLPIVQAIERPSMIGGGVVQIDNSINKPFKGTAKLLDRNKVLVAEEKITIPAKKSWTRLVAQSVLPNAMSSTDLILELTAEGKSEVTTFELKQSTMAWPKLKTPITLTGNLQEWQSAFQIPLVNRVEFPPYGESQSKFKSASSPSWNAGSVKNARLKVTRNAGVTLYELVLPVKDLNPIQLKEGQKFGFAPLINDDDGDYRKRALTLTPSGTEPSNRPDLFPTVILAP